MFNSSTIFRWTSGELVIKINKADTYNGKNINKNKIIVNSQYIYDILTEPGNEIYIYNFLFCVGHELGHNKAFAPFPIFFVARMFIHECINCLPWSINEKIRINADFKFRCRLVEVFCDHNAIEFANINKETLEGISEIRIKKRKNIKTDIPHPSWDKRREYLLKDFNDELIDIIAKDNNYNNSKGIKLHKEYYRTVKERNGYIAKSDKIKNIISYTISIIFFYWQ